MNQVHRPDLATLVADAGYGPDEPIVVGVRRRGGDVHLAHGLASTSLLYVASLSKQMTAACAALLVLDGALDVESPLSRWLPGLPPWAAYVRVRHLVHHTAGLPADRRVDARTAGRTTAGILDALATFAEPDHRAGAHHAYSNAGYVCLAAVVETVAGEPLPGFARHRLFAPLQMDGTRFWAGPEPAPPGAVPLVTPRPAPLSLGDGGVWSTLTDLLRWGQAMNDDELGVSALTQTPGRLDDGTPLDYAWGVGVRSQAGHRVFRHGGGWIGLRALHARVPALGLSVALVATRDHTERRVALMNGLLETEC
ncbi:serine hydrolase domain-containing protein [Nonomuraea sp. NPDC050663]|uniref:serine hydrolase domain-containing protein n=1 Tax=Nonomuraea sp. NPDC050663 TaxID=3364370 RepID=UPI0037B69A47